MTTSEVIKLIEEILKIPFGNLNETSKICEIDEWDSLANLQIIAELEERYNLKIPFEDIENINEVSDFFKYLVKR